MEKFLEGFHKDLSNGIPASLVIPWLTQSPGLDYFFLNMAHSALSMAFGVLLPPNPNGILQKSIS
jgi:hypothetical protein